MNCYIMVGISGSGKSTWIKNNSTPQDKIASADKFFYRGMHYMFDPSQLQEAHNQCMREFVDGVTSKCPMVFVDNTNLTKDAIIPYVRVAKAYGYYVSVVVVETMGTDLDLCAKRNIHNVPLSTIKRQFNQFWDSEFQGWLRHNLEFDTIIVESTFK